MLKPAWKSLEGQTTTGVVGALIYFLNQLIEKSGALNKEVIDLLADNPEKLEQIMLYKEFGSLGKMGIVLGGLAYLINRFTQNRTELKKETAPVKTSETR